MPEKREYDNTDRGVLFVNDKKDKQADGAPDYRGQINVEGREFWLSAWRKNPKKGGDSFLSISLNAKDDNAPKETAKKTGASKGGVPPL